MVPAYRDAEVLDVSVESLLDTDYEDVTVAMLVEPDDLPSEGDRIWLKGYGCLRYEDARFVATGDDISAVREEGVDVIHWVPADDTVAVTMRTPDGDVSGHAEPAFADTEVDEIVQFERISFVRVDQHSDDESVVYYTHA